MKYCVLFCHMNYKDEFKDQIGARCYYSEYKIVGFKILHPLHQKRIPLSVVVKSLVIGVADILVRMIKH